MSDPGVPGSRAWRALREGNWTWTGRGHEHRDHIDFERMRRMSDETEWQSDGHRLQLELEEGRMLLSIVCPNVTGLCRQTPDGGCYLQPFVEDLGLEVLRESYELWLPVAWRVPDEEPELLINGRPIERIGGRPAVDGN